MSGCQVKDDFLIFPKPFASIITLKNYPFVRYLHSLTVFAAKQTYCYNFFFPFEKKKKSGKTHPSWSSIFMGKKN